MGTEDKPKGNCGGCGETECVETTDCGCQVCLECSDTPKRCDLHNGADPEVLCEDCENGVHEHALTCSGTVELENDDVESGQGTVGCGCILVPDKEAVEEETKE